MGIFFQLTDKDFIIIALCILSAGIFGFLWADKLFKFYFWAIIGFLLFLVFNSEVWLVQILKIWPEPLDNWQNFLAKNGRFVLSFFACMIPLFWLFFALNKDIYLSVKKSFLQSILFWIFLPFFILWCFVYALKNSALELGFLKDLLSFFDGSFIKTFFEVSPYVIFYILLFILFYKMIFTFCIWLLSMIFTYIVNEIRKRRWEDPLENWGKDDEDEHDEHSDH